MENFCCCKELPETTKGQDIFNILSSYLESCGLSWSRCVGICTGGGSSMIGSIKGFVTLVKEKTLMSERPTASPTGKFLFKKLLGRI
jgi:hypothetical protein